MQVHTAPVFDSFPVSEVQCQVQDRQPGNKDFGIGVVSNSSIPSGPDERPGQVGGGNLPEDLQAAGGDAAAREGVCEVGPPHPPPRGALEQVEERGLPQPRQEGRGHGQHGEEGAGRGGILQEEEAEAWRCGE